MYFFSSLPTANGKLIHSCDATRYWYNAGGDVLDAALEHAALAVYSMFFGTPMSFVCGASYR
jgi:hypothetical protein